MYSQHLLKNFESGINNIIIIIIIIIIITIIIIIIVEIAKVVINLSYVICTFW